MSRLAPDIENPSSPAETSLARRRMWLVAGGMASGFLAIVIAAGALAIGDATSVGAASLVLALLSLVSAAVLIRANRDQARANEERRLLTEVFNGVRAGRVILDANGAVFQTNRMFTTAFGDIGPGVPGALFAAPGMPQRLEDLWQQARNGQPASAEVEIVTSTGEPRWFSVYVEPLGERSGSTQWRFEDITARRTLDRKIEEERSKLYDFLDHAPIGFYSVDGSGRFLFVNGMLAQSLGWDNAAAMMEETRLHDVLAHPPREAPGYVVSLDRRPDEPGEVTLRGRDGRTFQAYITQSIVTEADGAIRTRSVVRDLTPEREWQEALRQSEHRFQRFFEDAPIGIALVDGSFRLVECNAAFLRMTRAEARSVKGKPVAEMFAPDEAGKIEQIRQSLDASDMTSPLDIRMSDEMVTSLYARRLNGEPGQAESYILHFIDTTEQKNLEVQFAQSQKMQAVGQLAGGIAHDFNNLLTAMIGFCDLLLLRHKPGDHSFGDIMHIKQNANRAANLVRQLLAFSRQQTLQPRILNITDALSELSNLLRRLIGENIELNIVHGRDLGLVRVDQGQFEQVIINLAVNARDAMPSGGRLQIGTSNVRSTSPLRRGAEVMPPGDYVLIEVSDTGMGIAAEHIGRIFEPFFSTKEVGSGTGLGLSTVYGIVRQTGGFIFVDSAPGAGARFSIYLPRHEARPEDVQTETGEARDRLAPDLTGVGSILLVEDEDAVRMFSARALRNKGYNVLEANSGHDALDVLSDPKNNIDLLISDVVMPQMDGPTLVHRVRESRPDLKVILISGYTEDKFRRHFGDGDTVHFLPKPFTLKQLAAKVKEVMREGD